MPPRLRLRVRPSKIYHATYTPSPRCLSASIATATTPAPSIEPVLQVAPIATRYPPTQPPSHKPPQFRKSQLHRQYTSLLRSSPLILVYQHNNLKANEWMAIRRELTYALRKVDEQLLQNAVDGQQVGFFADSIKIQIVQTGIFGAALKVVEFFRPGTQQAAAGGAEAGEAALSHSLSRNAYLAANSPDGQPHGLDPLISGPLAVVTFPAVTPQHLKAALSILSPNPDFPAPKRKVRPAYHDLAVQGGLQKLLLLGARVEGEVFDQEGVRWVGGIEGGIDGLRAQLVGVLQSLGASVTNALEGTSKSLYFTMESRKTQLEDQQNGDSKGPEESS